MSLLFLFLMSYLLLFPSEEDLEDDFDDDFDDDLDDEPEDLEEELLPLDTEVPLDDDGRPFDIDAPLLEGEELLEGALITLPEPELLPDVAAGLRTGAEDTALLTWGLDGAVFTEVLWVLPV